MAPLMKMATVTSIDLDAYLHRIGHVGSRAPTLATLHSVHEGHARAIPFENLDVLLDREIRLHLPALEQKLVRDRRGGYCFEHNTLLLAALRALGFAATPHLARVRWQVPDDVVLPKTHMILRVVIDDRAWLADAGFGSIGLLAPLALDVSDVQGTAAEPRRLVPQGRGFLQQLQLRGSWMDVYVFTLDETPPVDFEVANWFTSTHPQSRFRQNLIIARPDGDRRLTFLNREFTVRPLEGPAEKRLLGSPDELLEVLAHHFGLHFPPATRFPCPALDWSAVIAS